MNFGISRRILAPALAVAALSAPLLAQTYRGSINGAVTDLSGASVPNASVVATNIGTGITTRSSSSSAGEFLFGDVPLGTYSVTVTAPGFATVKFDGIIVSAGVIYTLPVKLAVSTNNEVVEVSAAALTLDTTTETQTTVLDSKIVDSLPLNGRDFTQMLQLVPGYAGYSGNGGGSLNGTRGNQVNWQIDGVDNNDLWHNVPAVNQGGVSGIAGIVLPLDAVDQFSTQTQAGPEGGRNPGGTVNLTLRSGTNHLHGSAYYFNRNELFGAKSPFTDTKQKVRNYNTGFSVGGPFLRDKLFGFVTLEHQRFVIGTPANTTLPSVGWQNQSKAILAAQGIAVSPVMQSVLNSLWGQGALANDTAGIVNNYYSNDPEFGYSWNGLAKVDYHLSEKDNLSAHWFVGQGNQVAPVGSQLLSYYEAAPIHVQNIAIVYNRLISSHISNELLVGVNYFNQVFDDYNTNFNIQSLGFITGASFPNAPKITIKGFTPVGETPPEGRNDITGHLTDQVSWTVGKHEIRFGGEYRQSQLDEFYNRNSTGIFAFDTTRISRKAGDPTYADGGTANSLDSYRYSLASFLAGYTTRAQIAVGDPERQVFVNDWFLNIGDSWKVNNKLNVNYGARYDYLGPLHNPQYANLSVFRPELTSSAGLAIQGKQVSDLYNRYFLALSPRLGLSYQASEKTVFRLGYGLFFDTVNLNPFLDNIPSNGGPNGVEGNPAGTNPVRNLSAPILGPNASSAGQTTIRQNVSIFGNSVSPTCTATTQCNLFSVNKNFRPAADSNYSVNIERTLANNVIAQVGFVGNQGRHLEALRDINQTVTQNQIAGVPNGTRPYATLYPQYGLINEVQSIGTSNYNALQTQLRLQNYHRVTVSATYTWSHNLDDVTAFRRALTQDSYNFKNDYSNSDYDTRNTFTGFVGYQVPGSNHLRPLTNGWVVNSLLAFHGGQPFSVSSSGDTSGANEGNQRANQIGDPTKGYQGKKAGVNWLNPAAFVDPPAGTFGTSRRNAYYGPGFSDVDLSVFKDTKIGELATIQFRAEMYNLFNRTNFAPPGFGGVSVGGDFTLDDTIGDYNGAPGIGAGEPFNTQFGLKVTF